MKMTGFKSTKRMLLCVGLALYGVQAAVAAGPSALDESFDAPLNGFPDGWTLVGTGDAPQVRPQIGSDERHALRMYRRAGLIYQPADGTDQFADMQGSIRFNTGTAVGGSNGGSLAVLLRQNQLAYSGTLNPEGEPEGSGEPGYKILIATDGSDASVTYLAIYSANIGDGHQHAVGRSENLTHVVFEDKLTAGTDYRLTFSAIGREITASLWTADGAPELLGTVVLDNAAYTRAGYFGINVSGSSSGSHGFFSDLEVLFEPAIAPVLLFTSIWER